VELYLFSAYMPKDNLSSTLEQEMA